MLKSIFLLMSFSLFCPGTATLKVEIKNIQPGKGTVVLAVYNNATDFIKKPIATKTVSASKATLELDFNLPDGDYAVATYQDLNQNKELDKEWYGMPAEPYGFSNNFRPRFSAPTFEDCKFKLSKVGVVTIRME